MQKFIIIGGMYRSGTTLTETIVGSHPDISIPPRDFHFFGYYKKGVDMQSVYNSLEQSEIWDRLNEEIARKTDRSSENKHDFSKYFNDTPRDAFINTLTSYAKMINKDIAGVKCPKNEFYYETIRDWLSGFETKFIHLVRNPFDMVASFQNSPYVMDSVKNNPSNIEVHSRNWCRSVSLALSRVHYRPQEYYFLKYEDLASNAVPETKNLCDFLGVDFQEKKMMNAEDFDYYGSNTSFGSQSRGSENKFIKPPESRKHYLNKSQIDVISSICGELAHDIGYDDQDFSPSFPDEIKPIKSPAKQAIVNIVRNVAQKIDK